MNPLRSMQWLRRRDAWFRLRALILVAAFAIGAIFARDALLLQQTLLVRAELALDATDAPSIAETSSKICARPSGVSRRAAMNPWDPPDDDDELDEDSDTVAPAEIGLAIPAACAAAPLAHFVDGTWRPRDATLAPTTSETRLVTARGPPSRSPLAV